MRLQTRHLSSAMVAALLVFATSCSSKWSLMPTPVVHQMIGREAYADEIDPAIGDRPPTTEFFYATNRSATGEPTSRTYGNGVNGAMELGKVSVRIGDPRMRWENLLDLSTQEERPSKVPVELETTEHLGTLAKGEDPASAPGARGFADSVNRALARSPSKDVFIYVHGAKSSFQRSMVQAAQFHHFMGGDSVLISLSWPTTQSFLTYSTDVKHAAMSVEPFADLLEFLAKNTAARKINILGYSAGSQVLSPGLFTLRQRYEGKSGAGLKRHFKLGEVYFAAPDIATRTFAVDHLPVFRDMVDRTTFTYNQDDAVLGISQWMNGVSRIGKPDVRELSEEEIEWLDQAAENPDLSVIDMSYEPVKRDVDFKPHGAWYLNPWASSDVILQFLFRVDPSGRGLAQKPDGPDWFFPADYPERLQKIIEDANDEESH